GVRLIDHVLSRLEGQAAPIALNANGPPARFAGLGLPVLADSIDGQPGPLAGVLAGLDWAAGLGAEHILTVAGDTPFFPRDLAARLIAASGERGIALAASPDEGGTMRRHPTFGLWPTALRADLRSALEGGLRKIVLWTDAHGAGTARWDSTPFDPFFNINDAQDIARAESLTPT
ncbi:MAG: molybdenum cofactor guanylyltransferase, partial [Paracoccus sp. (in: a-proteobacteria)]|nr:molybdenum cofactor guanylyltransferase [Paracoccus sp. (in: a-proteobacteria)]